MDFSLMPLDNSPTEFDYDVFLRDGQDAEDVDYLAEDSSASTSTNALTEPALHGLTPQSSNLVITSPQAPKQRLERRGHTKSRRGCFNCKRRRIKCQETRPACGHCVKTGLKCEYPAVRLVNHQPQHKIPLFSLQDMRFFQHFLLQCYPHQPLGSASIWTHEVPALSERYEYLMHAVLGLAASDLARGDASLVACAMTHRVKTIRAIKRTLAVTPRQDPFEEGNALMATCYALTFQSLFFDDGMAEYMTFIRGIMIVAIQMCVTGAQLLFQNVLGNQQTELVEPLMADLPLLDRGWTDGAFTSVEALGQLCRNDVEQEYHALLMDIVQKMHTSSFHAYKALGNHYSWWIMLPHEKFQRVIDPENQVCILMATHWIALQQIMATITEKELVASGKTQDSSSTESNDTEAGGMLRWLKFLNRQMTPEYVPFNQWPLWVEAQIELDRGFFARAQS